MLFPTYRPENYTGRGDKYLKNIANELRRLIAKKQNTFSDKNLKLNSQDLKTLSTCLVEFGEDIHNDIGIWKSLEFYNNELFSTPLPLVTNKISKVDLLGISSYRVHFFLWNLYSELLPDIILSPEHPDISKLAQFCSEYLTDRFLQIPKNSGVKLFLQSPNDYASEVKKKLVWLGTRSYLFRQNYENYIAEKKEDKLDIATTDDFICQECTRWSGLGVTDILARTISLSENQRNDLRKWHERHMAWYKILSANTDQIKALNIINDAVYSILETPQPNPFKENQLILASLTPWNGGWCWSGQQQILLRPNQEEIRELRKIFSQQCSGIIHRYHKAYLDKARAGLRKHYAEFLEFFGDNFILFQDGLSMAAGLQKLYRRKYESSPPGKIKEIMKTHGLKNPWPDMPFPEELLDCEEGVALFFNKDEGVEVVQEMNQIIDALKKKSDRLTKDEQFSMRALVKSDSVSCAFILYLVGKFGEESFKSAFLIDHDSSNIGLSYLLHKYKGHYYRTRYPNISTLLEEL